MLGSAGAGYAQTCGSDYPIKDGETLADIAARVYGSRGQWTVIFYSNQDRLGENASLLVPGLEVRLPCIGSQRSGEAPRATFAEPKTPAAEQPSEGGQIIISSMTRRLEFLTADGYAPYTGRALTNGGLITHIVSDAMGLIKRQSRGRFDYAVSWINDWSAHLNPLLLTRSFDLGFPWSRPDCANFERLDPESQFRCQRFFFSDPLYEVVTQLFVRAPSPIRDLSESAIAGKILCRPTGYSVSELDGYGRGWLKDDKITLMRPATIEECFRLLGAGTVDGVVSAELAGMAAASSLGMRDRIRAVEAPVSLTTLHVLISKGHPQARTMLYYVNAALRELRESGDYDKIVEQHLLKFWQAQDDGAKPVVPPAGGDGGAAQGDGSTGPAARDGAATGDETPAEPADIEPPAAATTAGPGTVRAN
jgi:polar amino acid transport system substrate-binding protein